MNKTRCVVFFCYATSDSPVTYSWTKNGQDPINDDIKVVNNNIVITPRSAQDYGVYVCNASNSVGITTYEITLSEDRKSSNKETTKGDDSECIYLACLFDLFALQCHRTNTWVTLATGC